MTESPRILPAASSVPDRDAETARLLVRGDQEGLRRLLVDHGGKVKGLLRKEFAKVLDLQEIDDAASQASVRVWRSGRTLDLAKGSLAAWFFTIARNCARRLIETKRREAPFSLVENLDTAAVARAQQDGFAEAADGAESAGGPSPSSFVQDVRACIERLPPQQRAVVLADLAAGGTADTRELADQLRTTTNSIYVSRANGRKALRAAMVQRGHMPETGASVGGWR